MKVTVVGASGNVGTALLSRLRAESAVSELVGVSRRRPDQRKAPYDAVEWVSADIGDPAAGDALGKACAGADAVVHLAWVIQPSHDEDVMRRVNVDGTRRVVDAAVRAGVGHVVHASSVGTYGAAPKDRRVDEDWPTTGVRSSAYSRHKVLAERQLDAVQQRQPELTVTRLRPGLIFQREAAGEVARYFLGPFAPVSLLRRVRPPLLPFLAGVRVQAVHADDVADAFWQALQRRVGGAFNIAAEPPLSGAEIAAVLGSRHVEVPVPAVRALVAGSWRLRLQPTAPGWVDLAAAAPLMDVTRAREVLGWQARTSGQAALSQLVEGLAVRAGAASPPLQPRRLRGPRRG